jgi:hypothetical protein
MKLKNKLHTVALLLLFALPQVSQAAFVNESEIKYEALSKGPAQITQPEFTDRIALLQKMFNPNVSRFGGKLSIDGSWSNDKIVAQTAKMFGTWRIQFSGGLARRPELTGDGMTLIICHEVGHLLGGFPFGAGNPLSGTDIANEGEADYFSTHVCAKKMWLSEAEKNAEFRTKVNPVAQAKCDTVYASSLDQDLCYRTTVGVESVIATMAGLKNTAPGKFETPDPNVVPKTNDAHPDTQCRMDTTFQGAICSAYFDELVIPGRSAKAGPASLEAETEASKNSCTLTSGFSNGLRPACWFKARL